jgi:hypothetical protein
MAAFAALVLVILASSSMNDRKLLQAVTFHLVMGAALGAIFAVLLLAVDAQHLLHVILHSTAPTQTLIVFVSFISMYFGFGAAITGFHFVISENNFSARP